MSELRGSTWNLPLNKLVVAKVRALNSIGWSSYSAINTAGVLIKTEPQAPPSPVASGASTDEY